MGILEGLFFGIGFGMGIIASPLAFIGTLVLVSVIIKEANKLYKKFVAKKEAQINE